MKKSYKFLSLLAILVLPTLAVHAQLTGTINVPSATYPTFASVITALNIQGVGAGGATINFLAGNPETAPAGGYQLGSTILNSSTTSANKLKILGNGNTLTAPVGTTTTVDGIFLLKGVDFVTIDSLNLSESSANTTGTTAMEWGYALLNLNAAAPFDGCQNDTIRKCSIVLNRTVVVPSYGIYSGHHTSASTALVSPATTADLHSNNAYLSNNISNVFRGIVLIGNSLAVSPTLFDQNTCIGYSASTGNTITNCMGTNYVYGSGIICQYTTNATISYNTVDNLAGGGVNTYEAIGIYAYGAGATFTINNNTVAISCNVLISTYFLYGIYCNSLTTNVTAQNNNITLNQVTGSAAGNCVALFTPNGNNNTLSNNTISQTQTSNGNTYGIYTTATGTVLVNGNSVKQTTTGTTATTCQFYSIVMGGVSLSESVTNNVFNGTNVGSPSYFGYSMLIYDVNATGNKTITGNRIINGYSHNSSTPFYGIYNANSVASNAGTAAITNNNFSGVTINGTGGMYAMYLAPLVTGPQNYNINTDTFSNFNSTINAPFYGIYVQGGANSDVYSNLFSDITTGGAIYPIYVNGNNTNNIYRNKLYNLTSTTSTGLVYGITVASGINTNRIYNNLLGNFTTGIASSTTDAIRGINLLAASVGTIHKVYYNTIYLNTTSTGTSFSTSGLYHTTSSSSTAGTLDLQNNIIINLSIPKGAGTTAAFRRSSGGGANYATTSGRNIFYAGTPTASNLIMTDGSSNYQTLASFQAAVAPADANSYTENSPFASVTGSSPNFLHFAPFSYTYAESSGANIAGITDDYDANIRQGNAGYTGNGTAPDIGADEFNNCTAISITTQPANDTACSASSAHFNVVVSPIGGFYQWQVNTGTGFTDIVNGGVYSGATSANLVVTNPPASMNGYIYRVRVFAGPTCSQTLSNQVSLAVTSSPSSIVTASGPIVFCEGDSVTLTVPFAGNLSYVWKINATNIPGANTNSYKVFNTGSYTVDVISTNGCTAVSTPVNVVSNPKPNAYVTYNSPLDFCEGGAVILNAFPYTGVTYQWYLDGNTIAGGTIGYQSASQTGTYTVKVTNSVNCTNTSAGIPILVHPTPQPIITLNGGQLSAQSGFISYQWRFGNSVIPGAVSQSYTPTAMGSYSVTVVDAFGCTNTSLAYFVSGVGVGNVASVAAAIQVYPSPASTILNIENKSTATIKFINVINSVGQVVYGAMPVGKKHTISLNSLAPGLYTLRMQTEAGVVNKRIEIIK